MSADRGVVENKSGPDPIVLYIPVISHLWFSPGDLSHHGLLDEYQEVYFVGEGAIGVGPRTKDE